VEFLMNSLLSNKIENLRKRLLDPSRRNKLINLKITPKNLNYLRVIDEFPDDILGKLMHGQMTISALPDLESERPDEITSEFQEAIYLKRLTDEEYTKVLDDLSDTDPDYDDKILAAENTLKDKVREDLDLGTVKRDTSVTLSEHAIIHGIEPSYELPELHEKNDDGRHDDNAIQTLLLPERLEKVSKSIIERSDSFIRETGINVFQVAFGILEWSPPGESTPFRSPICLLEAKIEKPKGLIRRVLIEGLGGAPVVNTSLSHKLYSEHRIELPALDGVSAEDYFSEVSSIAPPGWKWSVKRQIILGIFPSSKMAMYNDLDPKLSVVADNPLLEKLLTTTGDSENVYADNYDIDEPQLSKVVPYTVMDADSSQYSALIDAAAGKNMSIEGPPGSGKSQSIVNIIADAIRNNKRILFVAEKLTALEVVKNRLESVNLSHLVLSLQHTKKAKVGIYDNIRERIELASNIAFKDTDFQIKERLDSLTSKKNKLNDYSKLIGSKYSSTGKSIYEVIGDLISSSKNLEEIPFHLQKSKVKFFETLNELETSELMTLCDEFDDKQSALTIAPIFWIEASALILNRNEADNLCALADEFLNEINDVEITFAKNSLLAALKKTTNIQNVVNILKKLIEIDHGNECGVALLGYLNTSKDLEAAISSLEILVNEASKTHDEFKQKYEATEVFLLESNLQGAVTAFEELAENFQISKAEESILKLTEAVDSLNLVIDVLSKTAHSSRFWDGLEIDQALFDIQKLKPFLEKYKFLFGLELSEASIGINEEYTELVSDLLADLIKLARTFTSISTENVNYDPIKIRQLSETIQSTGFFGRFTKNFRDAIEFCHSELGAAKKTPRSYLVEQLNVYEKIIDNIENLKRNFKYKEHLGELAQGLNTDLDELKTFKSFQKILLKSTFFKNDKLEELFKIDLVYFDKILPEVAEGKTKSDLELESQKATQQLKLTAANLATAKNVLKFCKPNKNFDIINSKSLSKDLSKLRQQRESVEFLVENNKPLHNAICDHEERYLLEELLVSICSFLAEIKLHDVTDDLIRKLLSSDPKEYKSDLNFLDIKIPSIEQKAQDFLDEIEIDIPYNQSILETIYERLDDIKHALENPEVLVTASRKRQLFDRLKEYDLDDLVGWYIQQQDFPVKLRDIVFAVVAKNRADEIFKDNSELLNSSDGDTLNRLRKEFASQDKKMMELAKFSISQENIKNADPPLGISRGKKSEYTDLSLIRHELSKKNRIPIRALARRAFDALIELHPCWMMSPLAVSQYLQQEKELFDLVIIDEASQLTPENAIGALMRSKQAIVVGDTKQLPPTNFFQSSAEDQEDDDDIREDSESILDLANMVFTPIRQLRWHYRSKDASLIQFSNEWLYNNQLTIFPAANDQDPNFGVELVEVEGEFKGRVNIVEARAVIRRAELHAKNFPNSSLGIATMNSDQKSLIDQELELAQQNNKKLQDFVDYWEEKDGGLHRLFVKNLETVQGDERDVIFISTLYGPEKRNSKVYQRFGPINSKVGHRRLNVLFSRSKEKMVTFTSLKPNDILAHANSNKGVQMFKSWLEYCKTGYISAPETGGGTDSPFEDYVIEQIEAMGCIAIPQVGAGGFRIDIGVKHPEYPYGYLMAVECDGATYHSSYSARDRDRLRQEILEGLGWSFHRIWSTDWFNDQKNEVNKLQLAINNELAIKKLSIVTNSTANVVPEIEFEPPEDVINSMHSQDGTLILTGSQQENFVKQGSTILVNFLLNNETKEIRLLDQEASLSAEADNWIINVKTPIGQRMLDAEVEDIILLPNSEGKIREAEIIKID